MKTSNRSRIRAEGAVPIVIILVALIAGIVWFLYSSRKDADRDAHKFASELVNKVAVDFNDQYLHVHLSPEGQRTYLPSVRERMFARLREFGPLAKPPDVKGNVAFSSGFFDPHGQFTADLTYSNFTAKLEMDISRGAMWQVEQITLTGSPPPTPTPVPSASPEASPSPTPTAPPQEQQKPRRKKKG
ncbi:MAG: hypothetical protein ABR611_00335 [Chthoniobacterales bacterium]